MMLSSIKKGTISILLLISVQMFSQNGITLPESQNQKVSLSQWIGLVEVNVTYNSPNVTNPWTGKDRTGEVWGKLVPYGYHFVTFANKMIPWRAGAQTNTVFTISHDVKIEGQHLPAGKYGLFMLAGKEKWTIIFSKNYNSWGALYYDQKEDALRVTVKPTKTHLTKWLTYDFIERKSDHAVMALKWEYLSVPVKIEVPNINELYVEKLRSDLRNGAGFSDSNWIEAINFCVSNNINLEEALKWANYAIDRQWFGNKNYGTYSAKANVLEKLGRNEEARELRKIAYKTANAKQLSREGRSLLSKNKNKEALEVYTLNAKKMQQLARQCDTANMSDLDVFRFQLIGRNYKEALVVFKKRIKKTPKDQRQYLDIYMHYVKAKLSQNFKEAFKNSYRLYLKNSEDVQVINLDKALIIRDPTDYYVSNFDNKYNTIATEKISQSTAKDLVKKYFLKTVFSSTRAIYFEEIRQDHKRRYNVNDSIVIPTKDGAEVPIVLVRRRGQSAAKNAAILISSVYAGSNEANILLAASKGYVGVITNTRGKRLSKGSVIPFEYEHTDVYDVIDWISKQPWSNQKVGMFGGSYNGFTQWASMKHKVHPALKTIVPMVSIAPGIEYPMENNVLHNFSYSWNFYVTNNKFLDFEASNDFNRWNTLKNTWYKKGVAFNKLDSLDGQVNKLWNTYMAHPSYDDYWKNMIPYKQEFAKIDIPVLTITGYYDDSQRGAMYYFNEHNKYAEKPNHYLLIGPYDHWTAQTRPDESLRNYKLSNSALINIEEDLLYQWFDYILKGKKKPSILKDKVNFQVMDTDTWMHKPSLSAMTNDTLQLYLSAEKIKGFYALKSNPNPSKTGMTVDFKDRKSMNNIEYYPWPLEKEKINLKDGLLFKSEELKEDLIVNGSFLGDLEFNINKKDVDFSVILYQLTPEGKYFHLSYYIGRASFSKNREKRMLLKPNQQNQVHFENSKLISKKIQKGSRFVIVVNVNKNNNAQINYGTGKDVNSESIKDAKIPLKITFTGNSSISLPIWK